MGDPGETRLTPIASACLMGAATCVALAINFRDGEYSESALQFLTVSLVLSLAGILTSTSLRRQWNFSATAKRTLIPVTLVACITTQLLAFVLSPMSGWNWWSDDLVHRNPIGVACYYASPFIAWALAAFSLRWTRLRPLFIALVLAIFLGVGIWFIRSSPSPKIDVFEFQQHGAQALLHGKSPYSTTYGDIYAKDDRRDRAVYDPSMSADGHLKFGFPYPPLSLYLSTAGYAVAGDHRYAQLVAVAMTGALIAFLRPGFFSFACAILFLFAPRGLFIVGRGWTEPFVVMFFAATVFCAVRLPRLLPLVLGLFLASKQYAVLVVPLVPLLSGTPVRCKESLVLLVKAGIVALVVTAPFLVDLPAMWRSLVTVQTTAPFREDALSYLVWYFHRSATKLGVLPALVATGLALLISSWRCVRSPAGFAAGSAFVLLVFIALNKQAFANYYYFVIGAIWCGLAASHPENSEKKTTLVPG